MKSCQVNVLYHGITTMQNICSARTRIVMHDHALPSEGRMLLMKTELIETMNKFSSDLQYLTL